MLLVGTILSAAHWRRGSRSAFPFQQQQNYLDAFIICIKILGAGCRSCRLLEAEVRAAVAEAGIHCEIIAVTDYAAIASYGILQLPGLVINDQVVTTGRIPKRHQIIEWVEPFQQESETK